MMRTIRRTFRALPVACLLGVSCADGVVAPEVEPAARSDHASAGKTWNPDANPAAMWNPGEPADGGAATACAGASGVASASVDATDEPLPDDLCSIAEFRTGATQNGSRIVSAFIDATGGRLRIDDFEIVVPPGAVSAKTRFSIKLPPANAQAAKHALAEFRPHNVTFAVAVTVRWP